MPSFLFVGCLIPGTAGTPLFGLLLCTVSIRIHLQGQPPHMSQSPKSSPKQEAMNLVWLGSCTRFRGPSTQSTHKAKLQDSSSKFLSHAIIIHCAASTFAKACQANLGQQNKLKPKISRTLQSTRTLQQRGSRLETAVATGPRTKLRLVAETEHHPMPNSQTFATPTG